MKGFLAVCVVALAVSSSFAFDERVKKKVMEMYEKCKVSHPITPAEEDMVKKHAGVPSSKEAKCLARCILIDGGALKDGKYNEDIVTAFMETLHGDSSEDVEKAKKIIHDCCESVGTDAGDDECEFSYKMVVCNHEKADELGLKILDWE